MKVLVVIASYGTQNDLHLRRLLKEYRSMPYDVQVFVLSNIPKNLGADVPVVVGLPNRNPWSLPFAHKKILADRVNNYDLFIYSEDDVLVTRRNIDAFLKMTEILPRDELAGFLRVEADNEGKIYFIDAHSHYHWEPGSVRSRGEHTFAFFTNEHAGMYMLNREQLRSAIDYGGFLVEPHEERYHLPETAATDPYTQCGFKKMICVSHLDDFSVRHLPNHKHKGRPYEEKTEFYRQIEELLELQKNGTLKTMLFEADPKMGQGKWSKSYYEPYNAFSGDEVIPDLRPYIPENVRSVLSIGCGWGAIEGALVNQGIRVVGVPLDSVIAACAKAKGVEIVDGNFEAARKKLVTERFDCILMPYVLHLVHDPLHVLSSFTELLAANGLVVVTVPNFALLTILWRRVRRNPQYRGLDSYDRGGVHLTTHRLISRWFERCNLEVEETVDVVSQRAQSAYRWSRGLGGPLLAWGFIAIGKRNKRHCSQATAPSGFTDTLNQRFNSVNA